MIPPLRVGRGSAPLRHAAGARWVNRGWRSPGGFWQAWAMSMDGELQKHYALLLGIGSLWEVKTEDLKLLEKEVVIELV